MAESRDTFNVLHEPIGVCLFINSLENVFRDVNMSPDPSHQSEQRRSSAEDSYVTGPITHTENDDNDISYQGYEILPQDFNEANVESEDVDLEDSSSGDESEADGPVTQSTFDQAVKIELRELWNSSHSDRVTDIFMDSKKEEEIKNAMASFKLPSTSVPLWAKNIPEDQWKQQILSKINYSNRI